MSLRIIIELDAVQTDPDAVNAQPFLDAVLKRAQVLCAEGAIHVPGWGFTVIEVRCDYDQPLDLDSVEEPNDSDPPVTEQ